MNLSATKGIVSLEDRKQIDFMIFLTYFLYDMNVFVGNV